MMNAAIFPGKYFQGPGCIGRIGEIADSFSVKKPLIIWGNHAKKVTQEKVFKSLQEKNMQSEEYILTTDCTHKTADEITKLVSEKQCDIIFGIGGGKVIDMAKAVAIYSNTRVIIAPTIASNDSPTSACTVWYNDNHVNTGFDMWPVSPDVILVDSDVLVKAPIRMLKAGIADALATNIEAKASEKKRSINCAGGEPTLSVMALAQLCFDILMNYSKEALQAVEAGVSTPSFEKVLEANVLLSGIGWESGGLCTAHTLGNGLPDFPETHDYMHGEKVSFGIVTELILDRDITPEERERIVKFMVELGLPVCFEDLNMQNIAKERLMAWCRAHTEEGSFCLNHSFPVSAETLYNAMIAADLYGRKMKKTVSA